jgi:hypothetical protein
LQRKGQEKEKENSTKAPPPILPNFEKSRELRTSDAFRLMDFDPEEMTRQICLIDFEKYKAVKPWDFFNQGWTKKDRDVRAPNIVALIDRFNSVNSFFSFSIRFFLTFFSLSNNNIAVQQMGRNRDCQCRRFENESSSSQSMD